MLGPRRWTRAETRPAGRQTGRSARREDGAMNANLDTYYWAEQTGRRRLSDQAARGVAGRRSRGGALVERGGEGPRGGGGAAGPNRGPPPGHPRSGTGTPNGRPRRRPLLKASGSATRRTSRYSSASPTCCPPSVRWTALAPAAERGATDRRRHIHRRRSTDAGSSRGGANHAAAADLGDAGRRRLPPRIGRRHGAGSATPTQRGRRRRPRPAPPCAPGHRPGAGAVRAASGGRRCRGSATERNPACANRGGSVRAISVTPCPRAGRPTERSRG